MQRQITPHMIASACLELGMDLAMVAPLLSPRDREDAKVKLDELKLEAKKAYKKLAFLYHPDRNNGDDIRMKKLNQVHDFIQDLNINPPPPIMMQMPSIRIFVNMGSWGGSTSTSSTSTSTGWW